MKERIWTFTDKTTWGSGPWIDEPDKVQYPDPETGLPCLAVRGPLGSWCGYVGLSPGHPFYGVDYSSCPEKPHCGESYCSHSPDAVLVVHGGITFADRCQERTEGDEHYKGVCHIPDPGEEDQIWWLGFDTGHFNDYIPGMVKIIGFSQGGIYRTLDYIKDQNAKLAGQLAALAPVQPKPVRVFREERE